jgi:hypothetical protein
MGFLDEEEIYVLQNEPHALDVNQNRNRVHWRAIPPHQPRARSAFVRWEAMRHFGAHCFDCAVGHILSELAHYNWSSMSDDGDCAGIEIRALMMRVAGHMSNHGLAIVGEHYPREAAMRDASTHAGPIVIAVKVGCSARPTGSGKRKRIRKTQLWFSCRGKPEASDC